MAYLFSLDIELHAHMLAEFTEVVHVRVGGFLLEFSAAFADSGGQGLFGLEGEQDTDVLPTDVQLRIGFQVVRQVVQRLNELFITISHGFSPWQAKVNLVRALRNVAKRNQVVF